jgi:hypothetical protein
MKGMKKNKPVDDATFVTAWCKYAPDYGIAKVAEVLGMDVQSVYSRTSFLRRKRNMKLPPFLRVNSFQKSVDLSDVISKLKQSNIPFQLTSNQLQPLSLPEELTKEIQAIAMKVLMCSLEGMR